MSRRSLRATLALSLLLLGCHAREKAPSPTCDVPGADYNRIYRRGVQLIDPYLILTDRKAADSPRKGSDLRLGIACLDRALEIQPSNWRVMWLRGKAFQSLGEHASALASFREAYRLQKQNPDVGRELVSELLDTRQFPDAARIALQVSQVHPDNAGLKANLALALLMNGEVSRARQAVAEAERMDPSDKITKALRARIEDVATGARPRPRSLEELRR